MGVDVLLIKPDFNDIALMPPLGLGYLAAALRTRSITVNIHDNSLFNYNDSTLAVILKERQPKIVGIYAATPMIKRAKEIAIISKKVNKESLVVLGGPHPSYEVEETLQFADAVVIGEGEEVFAEIATRINKGSADFSNIKGCAFKSSNNEIKINLPRDNFIENLDSLPFPAFDTMPINLYFNARRNFGILQRTSKSLPIMASRGCPSNCIFCQRFLGSKLRVRSANNIADELSYLVSKYKVNEFNFLDDNFTLHKKRVIELCDLIHKRNLKISFRFPNGTREDFLDSEILYALKSAGCYHLDFGIESGSQRVLDIMKKGKKVGDIFEKVQLCHKKGFKLSASFLFGTPGETLEDMEKTINFSLSLPLDSAAFGIVIPFPGTELRREAIETRCLVKRDYEYYNPSRFDFLPLIKSPNWSEGDLKQMLIKANKKFFFRPMKVLKLAPSLIRPNNLRIGFRFLKETLLK
jgi:radical SAM superfamily enzyme YgiQ (UPF0313 family)